MLLLLLVLLYQVVFELHHYTTGAAGLAVLKAQMLGVLGVGSTATHVQAVSAVHYDVPRYTYLVHYEYSQYAYIFPRHRANTVKSTESTSVARRYFVRPHGGI